MHRRSLKKASLWRYASSRSTWSRGWGHAWWQTGRGMLWADIWWPDRADLTLTGAEKGWRIQQRIWRREPALGPRPLSKIISNWKVFILFLVSVVKRIYSLTTFQGDVIAGWNLFCFLNRCYVVAIYSFFQNKIIFYQHCKRNATIVFGKWQTKKSQLKTVIPSQNWKMSLFFMFIKGL